MLGRDRGRAARARARPRRPTDIGTLQAVAAVGQPRLMERIGAILGQHGLVAGQVLLTPHDFGVRTQYLHARETLRRLLDLGVRADRQRERHRRRRRDPLRRQRPARRARVAPRAAPTCSCCSPTRPGSSPPIPASTSDASLIEEIVEVDAALEARRRRRRHRRGGAAGMASKLAAAKIAAWSGVRAVIAAADAPDVVVDALDGRAGRHRRSRPRAERLPSRKLWIAFARGAAGPDRRRRRRAPRAVRATTGRCCRPGCAAVEGAFDADDAVEIVDDRRRAVRQGPGPVLGGAAARASPGRRTADLARGPARTRSSTATTSSSCPDRGARRWSHGRSGAPAPLRAARPPVPSHSCLTSSSSTGGGRVLSRGLRRSARSGRKVRPGRLGRCATRPRGRGGRHGLTPPERACSATDLRERARIAPRITLAACPRRPPWPSWGGGRRRASRLARDGVDGREERRAPRRRRPAPRARRPRSSPPTPPTSTRPRPPGMEAGPLDRLRLTDARLAGMADGLRTGRRAARPGRRGARRVAAAQRPRRSSGVRVPLGVVAIIYENRPNVTSDAAGHLPEVGQRRRCCAARRARCARTSRSPTVLRDGARQGRAARRRGAPRRRRRATRPRSR